MWWTQALAGLHAVLGLSVVLTVAGSGTAVVAAPNPVRSNTATHTVSIHADGSYRVSMEQTVDMAFSTRMTFGGTIHDGFRLPSGDGPIPDYLRAEYSDLEVTVDGSHQDAEATRIEHAVEMEVEEALDEGEHTATFGYTVTRASAIEPGDRPAEGTDRTAGTERTAAAVIHVRPLRSGDVTVRSAVPIDSVGCVSIPPDVTPCGRKDADGWTVEHDEFGTAGDLRIVLSADSRSTATAVAQ